MPARYVSDPKPPAKKSAKKAVQAVPLAPPDLKPIEMLDVVTVEPSTSSAKLLKLEYPKWTRPLFTIIIQKYMVEQGYDVEIYSETDRSSLFRAVKREGWFCCLFKIRESTWVARVLKSKTTCSNNPLKKEYTREYDTKYGKHGEQATSLSNGHVLRFKDQKSARRVMNIVREKFTMENGHPPFSMTRTPVVNQDSGKTEYEVALKWEIMA